MLRNIIKFIILCQNVVSYLIEPACCFLENGALAFVVAAAGFEDYPVKKQIINIHSKS